MKNAKRTLFSLISVFAFISLLITTALFSGPTISDSTQLEKYSTPVNFLTQGSHRSVVQIIDNTLHHWLEYENPDSGSFFIYNMSPEKKPLKPINASMLLARSRQWENNFSQIAFTTDKDEYDSPDKTAGQDGTAVKVELPSSAFSFTNTNYTPGERMVDGRTVITGEEATTDPYNTAGFLSISFPSTDKDSNNLMRATAFIISPYTIITNAHCLYANENGGLFKSADFYPAQYEHNSEIVNPYTSISPTAYDIDKKFKEYEDLFYETGDHKHMIEAVKHDLAALFTDYPITDVSTYVPLEFNLESNPSDISLIGYPGVVRDTETKGMWLSEGPILSNEDNILKYEAYTSGGNSGSPVLYYNQEADTYRIIAIHSFTPEDLSYSGGPYFSDNNFDMLMGWLKYTPEETDDNNGIDTEPDETVEVEQPILGDVNGDGDINVQDVVLTMRHALELSLLTDEAAMRADVNVDGEIDVLDVTLIMRFSLGLIDSF